MANGRNELVELLSPAEAQSPQESELSSLLRNIGRTGYNVAETTLGLPGDIVSALSGLGGGLAGGIESLLGLPSDEPYRQQRRSAGLEMPSLQEISPLPTSEQIRGIAEPLAEKIQPGILEPHSPAEAKLDEFTKDFVSILHPISGGPAGRVLKGAAVAGAGNLAKWGAQRYNFGQPAQEGFKLGTMFLSSLVGNKKNLLDESSKLFQTAEETMPAGSMVNAKPLENSITNLGKKLEKGIKKSPSKDFISRRLKELKGSIKDGKIEVEDTVEWIKDINDFFRENQVPKGAQSAMGKLIDSFGKSYRNLKDTHPEFVQSLDEAREIMRTVNTSSKINDFVQNQLTKFGKTKLPLSYLFGAKGYLAGSIGKDATQFSAKVADEFARSPAIRNQYAKVLQAAGRENAGAVARHLNKLNKQLEKAIPQEEFQGEEMVELVSPQ